MIVFIRTVAFYVGYILATVVWGGLAVLVGWLIPYRTRFPVVIGAWTRMVLFWLRLTCDIRPEVEGIEHLDNGPCVLLVKHQSTWETLFVQTLVSPQTTLIKRELLRIPFFGWAFALLKPIAIDRRRRVGALKQLIEQGRDRLEQGHLGDDVSRRHPPRARRFGAFPTRRRGSRRSSSYPGNRHRPQRRPISGPPARSAKRPGRIKVRVSEPIDPEGKTSLEINQLAEDWLLAAMSDLETVQR